MRRMTMVARRIEDVPRGVPVEQTSDKCGAVHRAFDSAVAHDERNGRGKTVRNRARERVAPSGDERDVDARGDGIVNRCAVGLRHAPVCVEERAVYVYAYQPDH